MPQGSNHKSVYVVEDDLELSTVLDRVLKSIDHRVTLDWSTTAEEAIQTLNRAWKNGVKRPYDLIIVDVFLDGDQNGLDLWNLCKREYPDIPVVLTSAHKLNSLFPKDMDPDDIPIFLQKPFSINECKKLFKTLLAPPDNSAQASA
ncbi:MAG: response regulator [Bdellovibrionales bacterium]|nr:response regulator [Bdellovibrionales bacterium]